MVSLENLKIVVLDDNAQILQAIQGQLERYNFKCTTLEVAADAIDEIKKNGADILIIDYRLKMASFNITVNEIKKINPEIYIILLTGCVDMINGYVAMNTFNIDSYVEKDANYLPLIVAILTGFKTLNRRKNSILEYFPTFEERLNYLRLRSNKSFEEVANALGVKETTIRGYESGKIKPSYESLIDLGKLYCASYDYMLSGE